MPAFIDLCYRAMPSGWMSGAMVTTMFVAGMNRSAADDSNTQVFLNIIDVCVTFCSAFGNVTGRASGTALPTIHSVSTSCSSRKRASLFTRQLV